MEALPSNEYVPRPPDTTSRMKRNMDLVKAILLRLEMGDPLGEIAGHSKQEIGYHVALLEDAGLITHEPYVNTDVSAAILIDTRMTWAGHEFLDAPRNDSFWERAKAITMEKTGAFSL